MLRRSRIEAASCIHFYSLLLNLLSTPSMQICSNSKLRPPTLILRFSVLVEHEVGTEREYFGKARKETWWVLREQTVEFRRELEQRHANQSVIVDHIIWSDVFIVYLSCIIDSFK